MRNRFSFSLTFNACTFILIRPTGDVPPSSRQPVWSLSARPVSKSHSASLFACLSSVSPARRGRHHVTRCESVCRCKELSGAARLQVWSITAKLKQRLNSSDFTCCCLEHVCHLKCTTRRRFCGRSWYTAACESEWAFNALEASIKE